MSRSFVKTGRDVFVMVATLLAVSPSVRPSLSDSHSLIYYISLSSRILGRGGRTEEVYVTTSDIQVYIVRFCETVQLKVTDIVLGILEKRLIPT